MSKYGKKLDQNDVSQDMKEANAEQYSAVLNVHPKLAERRL